MKKIRFRFGTKLIVVSCMSIIVIAAVISYFSYSKYQKSMEDKISTSVVQAFIQADELLDYNIRSYENLLYLVSRNKTVQQVTATTFENQYEWYEGHRELEAVTSEMAVSHLDNPEICYYFLKEQHITIHDRYSAPHELFSDDFVDENLATHGYTCVWSGVRTEKKPSAEGKRLLVSKLCVNDITETADALAYIIIENDKLFKSISQLDYEGGDIFVLSENNEILYAKNRKLIGNIYSEKTVSDNISLQSKGTFVENIDGTKSLVVYINENKNNWTLVGVLPYETVMQEIEKTRTSVLGATIIVTFIAFFAIYFYLYGNTKKVSRLSSAMEEAGNGNLDVQLHLSGHGEINQMADVFVSMLDKIKHQIEELEEARQREHKLELRALQEQINPHLLYNTLATINSQAEDIEAEEISHSIMSLITYYKLTLSEGMDLITVKDELSHVKAYIEIMRIRFGDYLTINTLIEPEVYPYFCPKIILQPFVENSIYHGFSKKDHYQGTINLQARLEEDKIVFLIEDNGCGMSEDKIKKIMTEPGSSFAVKNVDTRIKLCFGDDYGVRIISQPEEGCKVIITIPLLEKR